jgi:hypothetical protein
MAKRTIQIMDGNKLILKTVGMQIDVDNWSAVFRTESVTYLDGEVIIRVNKVMNECGSQ